jgi:hypothetical protein
MTPRRPPAGPRRAPPALAAIALACACASAPPREAADDRCTPDAAFERGLDDGSLGRAADAGWLEACPDPGDGLRDAYRDGHRAGAAGREAEATGADGARAYACEVQARGETFRGRGQGPAAAEAAARAACRARNGERFCGEVVCRPSE